MRKKIDWFPLEGGDSDSATGNLALSPRIQLPAVMKDNSPETHRRIAEAYRRLEGAAKNFGAEGRVCDGSLLRWCKKHDLRGQKVRDQFSKMERVILKAWNPDHFLTKSVFEYKRNTECRSDGTVEHAGMRIHR